MKITRYFLIILTFLLVFTFPFNSYSAIDTNPYKNYHIPVFDLQKSNGEFAVYVLKGNSYQEVGKLTFNKYFTSKNLDLSKFLHHGEQVSLMLLQKGGGASHIDSIFLGGKPR